MTKQELVSRWKDYEGGIILKEIINCLNMRIPLSSVDGLKKHLGRWDLRGAKLSVISDVQKIEAAGHKVVQKFGSLKVRDNVVESVDFSFSDISYSVWEKCSISNCLFEGTKAKELCVIASNFLNCSFKKTNLSYSFMNKNIGTDSGAFIAVSFEEANLSECIFCFPIVKNCRFQNCNLIATNFDGSRMANCQFIGEVNSPWFRGYSTTAQKSLLGLFNRVEPKKYPNEMENVDFSKANLVGVSFSHSIDLSECIFPKGEDYILINDLKYTMEKVRYIIESEWKGEDKRKGLVLIDNVYFKKDKQDQLLDIIDTFPIASSDVEFDNKFFNLIRSNN